jgi:uncharacterized coiled-coil protein SlyX
MKLKEQLLGIFQKFGIDPNAHGVQFESEVKLEAEARLADGNMIYTSADDFGVGSDCYMKDSDGNVFPVGAGEYPLEDGKVLIVGEDGKIAEVKEVEVESEMSSEDIIATINSLSQKISELQGALDAKNAELTAVSEELAKVKNDAVVSATELAALKKAPATASVKERKATLSAATPATKAWSQMTYQERVLAEIQKIQK